MEIKQSLFRRAAKSDPRKGRWVLRLKWEDSTGRDRVLERQFSSRGEALDKEPALRREILRTYEGDTTLGPNSTFEELVHHARREFYYPAVYEGGLITRGIKSYSSVTAFLDTLTEYFGKMKIGRISAADVREYREWRHKLGSRNPALIKKDVRAEVSSATINRELSVCRRLLKYAYDEGFIDRYVFPKAKAIHKKLENPRQRILTHEELDRLLAACTGSYEKTVTRRRKDATKDETYTVTVRADNPFIKPMILLAADSGMRKGEILSLKWSDVDLGRKRVTIRREETKTEQTRTEGLTDRTVEALNAIRPHESKNAKVIPAATERGWDKVRTIAGLTDIRFHDLRRTASTVLVRDLGLSIDYAMKLLGHSEDSNVTLKHYIAVDDQAIGLVTERLNELHRSRQIIETEGPAS